MAKQTINLGTTPNDGTGDKLRTAFSKVNLNFDELYASGIGPQGPQGPQGSTGATGPQGAAGASDTGDITFDATTISAPNNTNVIVQAKDNIGIPNARLVLNPEYAIAKLDAQETASRQFYSGEFGDFASGTWEPYQAFGQNRSRLILTGANSFYNFINDDAEFSKSGDLESAEWSIDDVNYYPYPYGYSWDGDAITFDFTNEEIVPPPEGVVTVDNLYLRWINQSQIFVDQDDYEQLRVSGVGIGVKLESTSSVNLEANDAVNIESINNVNLISINGYIKLETDSYGSTKQWIFNENGSLELPANTGILSACTAINFVPNSSGDGNGYSTIELRPDSNATNDQYIIIDPTAPSHIHIRAGGAQDASMGQLYIGGENSNFSVGSGENPPVFITANNNVWTYYESGVMQLPVLTYDALPSASLTGLRAFISDANVAAPGNFGAVISGGGSNNVPVFSDGTDWRIG